MGVYGVLSQTNAVMIMMGIELMISASILNTVAFWRYTDPANAQGLLFAIIITTVMAVEAVTGFAVITSVYRGRRSAEVADSAEMKE